MREQLTAWYLRNPFTLPGLLLGLALACAVLYSLQGPERPIVADAGFEEQGHWDYGGPLGAGVYDDDTLTSPQPFFLSLGDVLRVRYKYLASVNDRSVHPESPHGRYTLLAQVREPNGWARTFPLTEARSFEGMGFAADAEVDLRRVGDLVLALEAATEYRSPAYRLRLLAQVELEGRVAGQPLVRSFEHPLEFTVTDLDVRLDDPTMLMSTASGVVNYPSSVPRDFTIPLMGVTMTFAALPVLGAWAVGLAVVLLAVAQLVLRRPPTRSRSTEPARANSRWLVDVGVASIPDGEAQRAVLLTSLDALLRLAETYRTPVLHVRGGGAPSSYWLLADVVYVHRPSRPEALHGSRVAA
jgi:hypothetical protein